MFFLASGGPKQMYAKQTCDNNVLYFTRFLHHIILYYIIVVTLAWRIIVKE